MFDAPIQLQDLKLEASFEKHQLQFITPAKTSRETFTLKDTYLLNVRYHDTELTGIGECSPLWTLSIDPKDEYIAQLQFVCDNINNWKSLLNNSLPNFPSIQFGLETALLDLTNGGKGIIYPSKFTEGNDSIQINGLIWMNDFANMSSQIENKIEQGFKCVKLKIGAMNWENELTLLNSIRKRFSENDIEIRVDANGAFSSEEALTKLDKLAKLKIHSIEQPIMAGQVDHMKSLCLNTPIPIALDEELIGIKDKTKKDELLTEINPQFIILKPSLIGGIKGSNEWIDAAKKTKTDWWITSALEGNYALNSIAQFVYRTRNKLPQGLGTGQLYNNNFESRLSLNKDQLKFY
jgi:o-succinylbenzoate synthase